MTIKLDMWNVVLKGRIEDLLTALESWVETKDSAHKQLTTAFLNPRTARPFVDLYELGLRLRHILRRLAILASALSSNTPSRLVTSSPSAPQTALSSVFIGGAVAANSFHVLRSLRITHFLNATEDLFLPGTPTAEYISREFQVLRIPLRDDEDEDIEPYFFTAGAFIENAVNEGGRCLVHCHAGQSRSCALVIAWMLLYKSFNLRDAIRLVQRWAVDLVPRALVLAPRRPDSLTRATRVAPSPGHGRVPRPTPGTCARWGDSRNGLVDPRVTSTSSRRRSPTRCIARFVVMWWGSRSGRSTFTWCGNITTACKATTELPGVDGVGEAIISLNSTRASSRISKLHT